MQCVFHGIRFKVNKIGCRETINFFCIFPKINAESEHFPIRRILAVKIVSKIVIWMVIHQPVAACSDPTIATLSVYRPASCLSDFTILVGSLHGEGTEKLPDF